MKYIKKAERTVNEFKATFVNGSTSNSHEVAGFFVAMEDKKADVEEVQGYINMGLMIDPTKDWTEIQRILNTFKGKNNGRN